MNMRYRYWMCQILGWTFFTYLYNNIRIDGFAFRMDVFTDLEFYGAILSGIFYTHLLHLYLRKQNLVRYRFGALVLKLWFSVLLASLGITLTFLAYEIIQSGGWSKFMTSLDAAKQTFSNRNITLAAIVAVIWLMWHLVVWGWVIIYFSLLQSRFKRMGLESENRLKQAELDTLKSKLNPHFLFNALTSIRSLIGEDPARAQQAVGELSEVLRSAMLVEHQQQITFAKELEVVQHYLAIEKIRFEERLQVQYEIDPAVQEQSMPPMLLQTLVENAIKHGISQKAAGGEIRIRAYLEDKHYFIHVENTGQVSDGTLQNGFGITGTIKRLSLLYGDKATFSIHNTGRHTVHATVKLPRV
ncbi:sensor histidine kinase [Chitinophaga sp. SYP-B3965]|uniref:sensor histidine kinase n=1 Tax=Chitinophaga sp. SYP-B3965 TaxID=2663120 RepID=UPI00156715BF|nr:histidine kinase [Chitinophaga sp. SYP-B3965]